MGPLPALRVLEIGDRGEVAGKLLADAGADVIRVEPQEGARGRRVGPFVGDMPDINGSLHHAYWNANKRGITLDIETADGFVAWQKLVQTADVVVDSLAPDAFDALGYESAAASNPGLIWCSITPFGRQGPWRDFAVTDLVSMALGGPMMSTGYDNHDLPPIRPDGEHSLAIACEYATVGVLTALWQRQQTGRGQYLDVSIHEAVSCTTEGAFPNWEYGGRISQRQTGRHASPTPTAQWQIQCADGRHIALMGGGMPRDERVWSALMAWMSETGANAEIDDPKYRDRGMRNPEDRQKVLETIHAFVGSLPTEEVYRRGQACHLPWGFVRRPEENLDDPHWNDRGFFQRGEVAGHDGAVLYPGAPYKFTATPLLSVRRAPLLGEHNFEVYVKELGYTPAQLVALAESRVI